jgi:hypothetical protein
MLRITHDWQKPSMGLSLEDRTIERTWDDDAWMLTSGMDEWIQDAAGPLVLWPRDLGRATQMRRAPS